MIYLGSQRVVVLCLPVSLGNTPFDKFEDTVFVSLV